MDSSKIFRTDIDLDGNKIINATVENAVSGQILSIGQDGLIQATDMPQQDVSTKADNDIVAPEFSSSASYSVGDYVLHNGDLYLCVENCQRLSWENASNKFEPTTLENELKKFAPIDHSSTSSKYGKGSDTNFGHVKLCDDADSLSDVSGGIAATPNAVNKVNESLVSLLQTLGFKNIYYGTYSADPAAVAGDFSITWRTQPSTLELGDIVVVNYVAAQRQYAEKFLLLGDKKYRIYTGTLDPNTTEFYYCSTMASSSENGELSTNFRGNMVSSLQYYQNQIQSIKQSILIKGMIMIWGGQLEDIPEGWHLCDGSTVNNIKIPDLRDKFVAGAGEEERDHYAVGSYGGKNFQTTTINFGIKDLPAHKHLYVGDTSIPSGYDKQAGTWLVNNDHNSDSYKLGVNYGLQRFYMNGAVFGDLDDTPQWSVKKTASGAGALYETSHTLYAPGRGRDKAEYGVTDANHKLTTATFDNRPSFYALAYIMYVGI